MINTGKTHIITYMCVWCLTKSIMGNTGGFCSVLCECEYSIAVAEYDWNESE